MEKTAAEWDLEAIEKQKETNEMYDKLDEVLKLIRAKRIAMDLMRIDIRKLEEEVDGWKRIIRDKKYLVDKASKLKWHAKNSGL